MIQDGMYGVEVTLPKNRFVSTFVGEYLYTKYQSGPIYYDHSPEISDHIGGRDDYYNHGTYVGWQRGDRLLVIHFIFRQFYSQDEVYI